MIHHFRLGMRGQGHISNNESKRIRPYFIFVPVRVSLGCPWQLNLKFDINPSTKSLSASSIQL